MNNRSKNLIERLLKNHECWDEETREINFYVLLSAFRGESEASFYDEWYFPKAKQMFRIIKALGMFSDLEWEEVEVGYYKKMKYWWAYGADLDQIFEEVFMHRATLIWNDYIEPPCIEEIGALNVPCPLPKKMKQIALF